MFNRAKIVDNLVKFTESFADIYMARGPQWPMKTLKNI